MNPRAIIRQATDDGLILALGSNGNIKAQGAEPILKRWLPIIRESKPAIVAALQKATQTAAVIPERAESAKPDGGSLHDWAAALTRLQAMRRPADMTTGRWAQLLADAARFADSWGSFAASLGWQPAMAYAQPGGLIPWIDGGDILAICERSAVIRSGDLLQINCWRYDRLTGEPAASWRCWSSLNEPPV